MTDNELFTDLINTTKKYAAKVTAKKMTLSDYYFKMADHFNQMDPHKGEHMGNWFNFKGDAEEFKQLAKKELNNEGSDERKNS